MISRGRPRTLLAVPCPAHGDGPCPSPGGCAARRVLAGLPPRSSGPSRAERARRRKALAAKEQTDAP